MAQLLKNLPVKFRRPGFNAWVGKIPWRRKWQSTPVLLPAEFHGQRSRTGIAELDMTVLTFTFTLFKGISVLIINL